MREDGESRRSVIRRNDDALKFGQGVGDSVKYLLFKNLKRRRNIAFRRVRLVFDGAVVRDDVERFYVGKATFARPIDWVAFCRRRQVDRNNLRRFDFREFSRRAAASKSGKYSAPIPSTRRLLLSPTPPSGAKSSREFELSTLNEQTPVRRVRRSFDADSP